MNNNKDIQVGYCWDTGLVRKLNEDSILSMTFELRSYQGVTAAGLFAVADGMGGHNAGEIASELATRTFQAECISGLLAQPADPPLAIMENAFTQANNMVVSTAKDKSLQGMGTTLTVALVIGEDLYIAHIGDSRCYIINGREMLQVTKDHSLVQQMVEAGLITPEQARVHPRRNEITRVLGYSSDTASDLIHAKLYSGDNILLCSDGLHGVLNPAVLEQTVNESSDPCRACTDLIELANKAGGPDNISVIIVKPENLPSWQAMIGARTALGTA
ncbi:MAG: Stp1/IreP family PP2C-type Ser/Thr phosphatase [Dehalococcoidia bacterium]|nr:Stp1/IreP family PP2C-type Ser/Thr phosphatase [Dehalococcoidia bacterium]